MSRLYRYYIELDLGAGHTLEQYAQYPGMLEAEQAASALAASIRAPGGERARVSRVCRLHILLNELGVRRWPQVRARLNQIQHELQNPRPGAQ